MTPGMKTSEFLLAVISVVIGIGTLIMGLIKGDQTVIATGAAMVAGSVGAFNVSRGLTKMNQPVPAATPETATDAAKTVSKIP